MKNKKDNKSLIEKILQANFRNRPVPEIPENWRQGLSAELAGIDLEISPQDEEERIFSRYEQGFWRWAWISLAASLFIFFSLIYYSEQRDVSLKSAISMQIYKCLSPETELQ